MSRAAVLGMGMTLLVAAHLQGESWKTTKKVCQEAHDARSYHTYEECVINVFTLDPIGPAMGNIGTGNGVGGGLHYKYAVDANNIFTAKGLYSVNSSYVLNGNYRFVFRPIRPIEIKGEKGRPGQIDETKGNIDVNVTRIDLRTQDFYGLGPYSTLAGHSVYRHQQTWLGVNGFAPLPYVSGRAGIVGVLGEMKYVRPVTKGVSGNKLPSVNVLYGEAGAPASTTQPDFIETGVGLSIRTPTAQPVIWEKHQAQIMYQHYFQRGSKQYSFDRLEAWGDVGLKLLKTEKTTGRWSSVDLDRPWWKDALCMRTPYGSCEFGTLTFGGRVTTSYTSAGSSVPFYMQPTLGGADFNGVDTLRGLVDFRLRAPNRLLVQVDFDKPIAQIGIKGNSLGQYGLYGFFDAGNVSMTPGRLIDNGMRTDGGIGFSVAVQNRIVLRAYIAFGAGEGSHPNVKVANAF